MNARRTYLCLLPRAPQPHRHSVVSYYISILYSLWMFIALFLGNILQIFRALINLNTQTFNAFIYVNIMYLIDSYYSLTNSLASRARKSAGFFLIVHPCHCILRCIAQVLHIFSEHVQYEARHQSDFMLPSFLKYN